jgi:arsenate reductase
MAEKFYNVLFLGETNAARSLMAESLMSFWGKHRFQAFSAGRLATPVAHPYAIELLNKLGFPTVGLRSKSWETFVKPEAPEMDFVFIVCERAKIEPIPPFPGQPMTAEWSVADPASVAGTERKKRDAFRQALRELENRIKIFVNLRVDALDRLTLEREVRGIGQAHVARNSGAAGQKSLS